jgi:hypothetical protein
VVADIVRNIILHYVTYYRYINITAFDRKVDKGLKDILQSILSDSDTSYNIVSWYIL